MKRNFIRSGLISLAALAVLLVQTQYSTAAQCDRGACNARITTSIWNGQPTLQCSGEDIVVKIVVVVCCPGACSSTQTFYRCGQSTESYQFSACGLTHTVSLTSGTWEDAISDCTGIAYASQ